MTSKTGIRVRPSVLGHHDALAQPLPNPRAKIDASFRATIRIVRKTGLELRVARRLLVAGLVGRVRGRVVSPIRFVLVTRIRHSYSPAATWL